MGDIVVFVWDVGRKVGKKGKYGGKGCEIRTWLSSNGGWERMEGVDGWEE